MKPKLFEYDSFGAAAPKQKKSIFGKKTLVFLLFFFVIGIMIFSVFKEESPMTGSIISDLITQDTSISILAELTIPEIELKGEYSEIKTRGLKDSSFYVGGNKFSLSGSNNEIIVKDFSGNINFDDKKITYFDGNALSVIINGDSVYDKDKGRVVVFLNEETEYQSILFKEDLYIEELEYTASGEVTFQNKLFKLSNEELFLNNFLGSLEVKDNKMILNGFVQRIMITGSDKKIDVSR
jgi:hypothetical protein